jgi:hypothetical protein
MLSRRSGLNPTLAVLLRYWMCRTASPQQTSKGRTVASWPITSRFLIRLRDFPGVAAAVPSFKDSCKEEPVGENGKAEADLIIHPDVGEIRVGQEDVHRPDSHDESEPAADEREHHALGEKLAHDAPAPGPQSHADGDLAAARRRPRHHEVRQVDAGDHENPSHRDEQGQLEHGVVAREEPVQQGLDENGPAGVAVRIGGREAGSDGAHLGLCLFGCDLLTQPGDGAEPAAHSLDAGRIDLQRHEQIDQIP